MKFHERKVNNYSNEKECIFIVIVCFAIVYVVTSAGKTTPFWGKQEVYLINQTEKTFHLVDALLKENLPSSGNPALARKAALQLLDGIFHDTCLDGSETLSRFMESRLSGLLEDMQKPLEEGMKVYKLYNDGFIVKTKSVTVAFDLYRGGAMKKSPSLISDKNDASYCCPVRHYVPFS